MAEELKIVIDADVDVDLGCRQLVNTVLKSFVQVGLGFRVITQVVIRLAQPKIGGCYSPRKVQFFRKVLGLVGKIDCGIGITIQQFIG